jgi:hypothetical protein
VGAGPVFNEGENTKWQLAWWCLMADPSPSGLVYGAIVIVMVSFRIRLQSPTLEKENDHNLLPAIAFLPDTFAGMYMAFM